MIHITLDKNAKNLHIHFDDVEHELNEYQLFIKEHFNNLRQKYMDMIKIYWYLPSDCYGLNRQCDDIFRTDSKSFKYVKNEYTQYTIDYYYDNK